MSEPTHKLVSCNPGSSLLISLWPFAIFISLATLFPPPSELHFSIYLGTQDSDLDPKKKQKDTQAVGTTSELPST